MDEIAAYRENQEERLKSEIALLYRQARWISFGFNEPKKTPTLSQEFPDLFGEEPTKKSRTKKLEKWEIEKRQMALYAEAFNRNRKGAEI